MTDDDLVDGLKSRNFIAQGEFLEGFSGKLSDYFLKNEENLSEMEIEDIIFDRLYFFIENPEKINLSLGSIWSLLRTSVRNKICDVLRSKSKAPHLIALRDVEMTDYYSHDSEDNDSSRSQLPPHILNEASKIMKGLKITESENEHLRLRLEEKFESKEVAKYLGITPGAESVRWNRLMAKINTHFDASSIVADYRERKKENVM